MIDRSYLPFKSAREHQDRGMEKWLGFYLSEHTSSLNQDRQREDLISDLSQEEKFFLYRLIEIEEILELALADEGVTPKSLDSIDL